LMFPGVPVTKGIVQGGDADVNREPADHGPDAVDRADADRGPHVEAGSAVGPRAEGSGGAGSDDRRRTRWVDHRRQRRDELISAAVAAILRHGPEVDMAQVAAVAGVSTPV